MFNESQLQHPGWTIWLVPGTLISESVVMMLHILHFSFSYFLLHVDATVYGNFDFMRILLLEVVCMHKWV